MRSLNVSLFLAALIVAAAIGAGVATTLVGREASAQAGVEPLPPDLRAGVLRPIELKDEVQQQYAIQDHYGEWVKLYRVGAPPTTIWMNLATHESWEVAPTAPAPAAPAPLPAPTPQVLPAPTPR